ncbi:MAG: type I DNA topoisomerase [Victivallaceae bacterium]|nr:type I DNA topoisomerase [Victivallaceae bacterium]
MANKLVIVESPTKARTISKMLGKDFNIMASMGHIRDLPERTLGVDVAKNFEPSYVESERGAKVIKDLRNAAKKVDAIYLAPDPDREGEAIAWHLKEVLSKQAGKNKFHRVTFHEITKTAVDKAFKMASDINMNLVDAQQARRVIDRLVGYKVSPMVKRNVSGGSSAGRVQSVALLLICDREEKIRNFIPEEYWDFNGTFISSEGDSFDAKMFKIAGGKAVVANSAQADAILSALNQNRDIKISAIETKPKLRNPGPPYITSTLQQSANSHLKMSATRTMQIAQQLYEGIDLGGDSAGLITYMRTDSVNIAAEARDSCREFIRKTYGNEYLPAKPNFYKSGKTAQEAHEAIRPTDVSRTPEMMAKYLDHNQLRLYTMIWKRFVASQMKPCRQSQTTVTISVIGGDGVLYDFRTSALVTVFAGFMKLSDTTKTDDDVKLEILGRLKQNQQCALSKLEPVQKFTEPPSRYSEATLIKELEACGVGRPSTYATIIRTIQLREYVNQEKGMLIPTEPGLKVNDYLKQTLPELINVDYTSQMEKKLDQVEEGEIRWTEMLQEFYEKFLTLLDNAKKNNNVDHKKVQVLIDVFGDKKIQWDSPRKVGKRTYDDQKFFNSLVEDFKKTGQCSKRQWETLLGLAVRYAAQLNDIKSGLLKVGIPANEIENMLIVHNEREERRQASMASDDEIARNRRIFEMLASIPLDKERPGARGRKGFDEGKFFNSLKEQAMSGKVLSPKQTSVLVSFAKRHRDAIADFEEICALLGMDVGEAEREVAEKSQQVAQYKKIFTLFDEVKWAEPSGRSRKNDAAFFKSLKTQALNGKILSDKQKSALIKLANQYQQSMSDYPEFCKLMGCEPGVPAGADEAKSSGVPREDLTEIFKKMDSVTEWGKPVKRGKKTYSDEDFYGSLKKQYESGKELSQKQVACLKKMLEKYSDTATAI